MHNDSEHDSDNYDNTLRRTIAVSSFSPHVSHTNAGCREIAVPVRRKEHSVLAGRFSDGSRE
jgi:hypothetical protein